MHSRKMINLWCILTFGATFVSAFPVSHIEPIDTDCELWDTIDDSTLQPITTPALASTRVISTTQHSGSLPTSTPSSTFVTSLRTSQSSTAATQTTKLAFVAPVNTFIPVVPPSYAFYLQSSSRGTSNGLYAALSAGAGQAISMVTDRGQATKFTIDSSGDLVEQSPSQGYVANLKFDLDVQKAEFDPIGLVGSYGRLNCQRQSGVLSCGIKGVSYHTATCGSDAALYFAKTVPSSCTEVVLVPVFP